MRTGDATGGQQIVRTFDSSGVFLKEEKRDAPVFPDEFSVVRAPKPDPEKEARPILLYNDQCAVCRKLSAWVKKEDNEGKDLIDERPIGGDPEELAAIHPDLDIWEAYEKIHLVMPDGTIKKGGEAVGEVLKRLPSQNWYTWLLDLKVGDFKPFQSLLNGAYEFLDAVRPALGCESCGGGPVVWWAKPIKWVMDGARWLLGKRSSVEDPG